MDCFNENWRDIILGTMDTVLYDLWYVAPKKKHLLTYLLTVKFNKIESNDIILLLPNTYDNMIETSVVFASTVQYINSTRVAIEKA